MTHKEYADGLRQIAEFFEKHGEVKLPHDAGRFEYYAAHTLEDMSQLCRALGSVTKSFDTAFSGSFEVTRDFGSIQFRAVCNREAVCKRVVVGKKHVPLQVIPSRVIEAHDEDVMEWDCNAVLAAHSDAE